MYYIHNIGSDELFQSNRKETTGGGTPNHQTNQNFDQYTLYWEMHDI